jgi:hypothetical protein
VTPIPLSDDIEEVTEVTTEAPTHLGCCGQRITMAELTGTVEHKCQIVKSRYNHKENSK